LVFRVSARLCYNLPVPFPIITSIAAVAAAYLLGSISWAYVIGRFVRGVDMTEVGDARIGAAFSMRRLGFGWGLLVGFLDFSKGAISVGIPLVLGLPELSVFLSGVAVVAGHNWSVFLGFKGGRGAAASFGVLAVLAIVPVLIGGAILALPYYWTRRSLFVRALRRTTLFFGIWMALISIVISVDAGLGILPATGWAKETLPATIALPPCLLVLNVLKEPRPASSG
jgi:acyl-phosphate glycerol 3-phosphate acyltransferase